MNVITDLPPEILVQIGGFLILPDLIRWRQTCRQLNTIVEHHWLSFDTPANRAYLSRLYTQVLIGGMPIKDLMMTTLHAAQLDDTSMITKMDRFTENLNKFIEFEVAPQLNIIYTFEELTYLTRTFASTMGRQIIGKQTQVAAFIAPLLQTRLTDWIHQLI